MTIQHLRSSTANKRPTPAAMSDGQLAVNTNTASPGLFFKDSAGALIKVGPVHVGTTAPNASPASGGETGNTVGEQWLDTTGGTYVFKVWDGSAWRSETGTFVDVNGDVMTGALGIIAGSAGSPGLYFSGDTNTGIYSPGADQVAISTGGSGRLFVDASGNVGVGASSLSRNFTVGNASSIVAASLVSNPANIAYLLFGDTDADAQGRVQYNNSTDSLELYSAGSERLRITSAGLVGVGDNAPDSTVTIKAAAATTPLRISGPSSEFLRCDQSGRLLLGTSSDSGGALLQVNGDRVRIATAKTPASATDTGTAGEICWDASYVYVCTATNTWKRSALSTW